MSVEQAIQKMVNKKFHDFLPDTDDTSSELPSNNY